MNAVRIASGREAGVGITKPSGENYAGHVRVEAGADRVMRRVDDDHGGMGAAIVRETLLDGEQATDGENATFRLVAVEALFILGLKDAIQGRGDRRFPEQAAGGGLQYRPWDICRSSL